MNNTTSKIEAAPHSDIAEMDLDQPIPYSVEGPVEFCGTFVIDDGAWRTSASSHVQQRTA